MGSLERVIYSKTLLYEGSSFNAAPYYMHRTNFLAGCWYDCYQCRPLNELNNGERKIKYNPSVGYLVGWQSSG